MSSSEHVRVHDQIPREADSPACRKCSIVIHSLPIYLLRFNDTSQTASVLRTLELESIRGNNLNFLFNSFHNHFFRVLLGSSKLKFPIKSPRARVPSELSVPIFFLRLSFLPQRACASVNYSELCFSQMTQDRRTEARHYRNEAVRREQLRVVSIFVSFDVLAILTQSGSPRVRIGEGSHSEGLEQRSQRRWTSSESFHFGPVTVNSVAGRRVIHCVHWQIAYLLQHLTPSVSSTGENRHNFSAA